jgi:hypothetical protein
VHLVKQQVQAIPFKLGSFLSQVNTENFVVLLESWEAELCVYIRNLGVFNLLCHLEDELFSRDKNVTEGLVVRQDPSLCAGGRLKPKGPKPPLCHFQLEHLHLVTAEVQYALII